VLDYPKWVERALQGITFWVGHRRCVYRGYPLAEAALVAEVCNLIYANLPKDFKLQCEVQYSDLLKGKATPDSLPNRTRADLVVVNKKGDAEFVIEVKRATAPKPQIDADLRRLAAVHHAHGGGIRAFMFLISEAKRPHRFVDQRGHSIRGARRICGSNGRSLGKCRVRHTWKAAHALTLIEGAQYACLLEVYGC